MNAEKALKIVRGLLAADLRRERAVVDCARAFVSAMKADSVSVSALRAELRELRKLERKQLGGKGVR